jgi:insulysin
VTTYKFEILADHAEKAIDIFSQFFVAPLFTQSGTTREVNAVDSENSKNLTSDARRRLQVLKALADQNHYYSKFTTGNKTTLPTDNEVQTATTRQALLDFHCLHYRPENMTVVVAGPQDLDTLQSWVVPRFAPMKAREFDATSDSKMTETQRLVVEAANDVPPFGFKAPEAPFASAFKPEIQKDIEWPFLVTTKPVQSMRQLVLMFPLPPAGKNGDQSPLSVLSHLIGHEGPNSSFAILQNLGLLSSLSSGPRHSGPDFTLFQVSIGLTEKGEEEWKLVADVIFQHCRLIHKACLDTSSSDLSRIWGESATLHSMFFDQTSPGGVYDLAPSLSQRILQEGTEHCFSSGSMLNESAETFALERVTDFVSRMVPSNCFVERCSKSAWEEMEAVEKLNNSSTTRAIEKWYGIDYFIRPIDLDNVRRWEGHSVHGHFYDASNELSLPQPNRFIPRSLELCPDLPEEAMHPRIEKEIEPPQLLIDDIEIGRLWHRLDDRYALPKSVLVFLIRTAAVDNVQIAGVWQHSPKASVHSSMISGMFQEALAQETYDAHLAGLHWGLSLTASGIQLTCSGFSDRLPDLAVKILTEFLSGAFLQQSYFSSTKERTVRSLTTFFESRRADSIAHYYSEFFLASRGPGKDVSLEFVESATLDSITSHFQNLLGNREWAVDCLFSGNVSEKQAKEYFVKASQLLHSSLAPSMGSSMWLPGELVRRLTPGEDVEFHFSSQNKQEENGAVLMMYQSHIPGYRGEVLSTLESLKSSAAMRLLCHILREPLFNELRTKQTLGYIVSSYYDISFSMRSADEAALGPQCVPVDSLSISVLSRKVSPIEVMSRIDDFLIDFRKSLIDLPSSEIQSYASALSTKLLKPIQKLPNEANNHFSKIRRYAPEILEQRGSENDIPWDGSKQMAHQIEKLSHNDLIEAWDRLILPKSRARIVSCVYGTTFPLQPTSIASRCSKSVVVIDILPELLKLRNTYQSFNNTPSQPRRVLTRLLGQIAANKAALGAVAAATAIGVGWTIMARTRKTTQ